MVKLPKDYPSIFNVEFVLGVSMSITNDKNKMFTPAAIIRVLEGYKRCQQRNLDYIMSITYHEHLLRVHNYIVSMIDLINELIIRLKLSPIVFNAFEDFVLENIKRIQELVKLRKYIDSTEFWDCAL